MRILGIDPGLAAVGWGVIVYPKGGPDLVRWGQIKTPAGKPLSLRLRRIHESLVELIEKERPEVVAVEQIFFATNVKTAITVAQARGVALLAAAETDTPVAEYTPLQIKKAVTGRGNAGKAQVQKMVATLLGLREIPRPDHAADALAAALCHGHTLKSDRLIRAAHPRATP
ncbi:crossover junction endodeoxyribonuclease RuvC [Candidatus Sumerlaeota bacterium]|nr:crossover junction endodeoxyribonuclease RuvC [Candidatus Sumerlaeota bacterium]